ncbi:mandelate racemase/muconate lactonizing enzyme family protein [Bacteroidota bacterium]
MNIKQIDPFILHIPVTGNTVSDSTHTILHWGVVGAKIETDEGFTGWGYTGTHAFLPGDHVIAQCIKNCYSPLLIGESVEDNELLWQKMTRFPAMYWIGRAGITQLAIAAIDTALWDLKAKKHGVPLWKLLGGATIDRLPAYNTDIGWLSLPVDTLIQGAVIAVEVDGFRGVKIKVGFDDPKQDLNRLEAVRNAIGPDIMMAIDGNCKWDVPTCLSFCKEAATLDVFWFEEPTFADDVHGHSELVDQTSIPVALGESLYNTDAFQTFIDAEAVHYVQPDITRVAGITEFLKVADMAHGRGLPVAPHVGDMGQVHVHLGYYHPACSILEYIPWIKDAFVEPICIEDGYYLKPELPGAGTTPKPEALDKYLQPIK